MLSKRYTDFKDKITVLACSLLFSQSVVSVAEGARQLSMLHSSSSVTLLQTPSCRL